jgi:hypothetical protein
MEQKEKPKCRCGTVAPRTCPRHDPGSIEEYLHRALREIKHSNDGNTSLDTATECIEKAITLATQAKERARNGGLTDAELNAKLDSTIPY